MQAETLKLMQTGECSSDDSSEYEIKQSHVERFSLVLQPSLDDIVTPYMKCGVGESINSERYYCPANRMK